MERQVSPSFRKAFPAATSRSASGNSRCSTAWTRSASDAASSPGSIATASCAMIGPRVDPFVDEVNRRAGCRRAGGERLLDGAQSREGGQERGMDVHDAPREGSQEAAPQQAHESGQRDQLHAARPKRVDERGVEGVAVREGLAIQHDRFDAQPRGAFQNRRAGAVAQQRDDAGWLERSAAFGLHERLEVRAIPRGEDGGSDGRRRQAAHGIGRRGSRCRHPAARSLKGGGPPALRRIQRPGDLAAPSAPLAKPLRQTETRRRWSWSGR
jgi:hypothetical protein